MLFLRRGNEVRDGQEPVVTDHFTCRCVTPRNQRPSLQLRILGLGLRQDGDVSVGVFPKLEEVLIFRF